MSRSDFARAGIRWKVVALLLLLVYAPLAWAPDVFATVQSLRRLPFHFSGTVIYLMVVVWALAALVVAPFLQNNALRITFVTLFLTAFAVDRIVLASSGAHVDGAMLQIFWQDRALAFDVLRDQFRVIGPHALAVAVGGVALAWPTRGLRTWLAVISAAAI